MQAYQAASGLVGGLNLIDFPSGDYDAGYEITVATARGSFQVRFLGSELYGDKLLRERLTRLVDVLDRGLPPSARIGRVEGR
jgi:hypothetical protein